LDKGNLFGSRGIVAKRNKGTGRVVLRVAGAEVKIERHLLGTPLKMGLSPSTSTGDPGNGEISAKEKRMLKMLEEELVDPDKMLSGGGVGIGKNRKLAGLRVASNTVDVRSLTGTDAQSSIESFVEKFIDQDSSIVGVIYVNHGNSKTGDALKSKLRSWLQTHPLVRRAKAAELSDGGDAFTVVELDF
jgi:DNA-nicking Smr family endonuclease